MVQVFDYSAPLMFVPSHLEQHLGKHNIDGCCGLLLEVCVCCWVNGCVCLFACWCFSLLLRTGKSFAFRVCVRWCSFFLRVALSGENEGLHFAGNSRAWFWKKDTHTLTNRERSHSTKATKAHLDKVLPSSPNHHWHYWSIVHFLKKTRGGKCSRVIHIFVLSADISRQL